MPLYHSMSCRVVSYPIVFYHIKLNHFILYFIVYYYSVSHYATLHYGKVCHVIIYDYVAQCSTPCFFFMFFFQTMETSGLDFICMHGFSRRIRFQPPESRKMYKSLNCSNIISKMTPTDKDPCPKRKPCSILLLLLLLLPLLLVLVLVLVLVLPLQ